MPQIDTDIETVDSLGRNFDDFANLLEISRQNLESYVDGVGKIWEAEAYNKFRKDTLAHVDELKSTIRTMHEIAEELQSKARNMRQAYSAD